MIYKVIGHKWKFGMKWSIIQWPTENCLQRKLKIAFKGEKKINLFMKVKNKQANEKLRNPQTKHTFWNFHAYKLQLFYFY